MDNKTFTPSSQTWKHDSGGNDDRIPEILMTYFTKYFTEELFELFSNETNNYALISNGLELGATTRHIKKDFWCFKNDGKSVNS